jgi:hypothetical protein
LVLMEQKALTAEPRAAVSEAARKVPLLYPYLPTPRTGLANNGPPGQQCLSDQRRRWSTAACSAMHEK